jgi:hypothetical protein
MLTPFYNFANIEVSLISHHRQQIFCMARVRNPQFKVGSRRSGGLPYRNPSFALPCHARTRSLASASLSLCSRMWASSWAMIPSGLACKS